MVDDLLPALCLYCRAPAAGQPICHGCAAGLPWNAMACRACALPLNTAASEVCARCLERSPLFDCAFAAWQGTATAEDTP